MSMTLDDHDMIVAFRSGDDAVFDDVVTEHRDELLRHAARSAPDAATAEDLVQETFVRAYRAFAKLPDDSRIRPWLHQILRNVCIDDAHRRRREHDRTDRANCEASRNALDVGPEEVLGLDHDTSALDAALDELPATHRDAFVQRVVVGLDYDEIATREGVSEPNARARVSRARAALRRALQGAAALPIACYLLIRRPGRGALAAPPDPSATTAATTITAAPTTVDTAGRLATSLAPAVEAATNIANGASHTVPLLTKAAVGIGAVATVTLATGPEQPIEIPPAVTVEVTADALDEATAVVAPLPAAAPEPVVAPVALQPEPRQPAVQTTAVPSVTTTAVAAQPEQKTLLAAPEAPPAEPDGSPEPAAAPAPVATPAPAPQPSAEPDTGVAPATQPATTQPPTTQPATTVPPTTVPPTTTPPTTVPPTTVPPPTGGSMQASASVAPAGPRLDLAGTASITVAGTTSSGSLDGRLGVDDPDPAGARRIDGVLTLSLDAGTLELRLAGHGTSAETTAPGVPPTSLTMSGVYRASGATGQLVTSGSFSGTLSGGALTLSFTA